MHSAIQFLDTFNFENSESNLLSLSHMNANPSRIACFSQQKKQQFAIYLSPSLSLSLLQLASLQMAIQENVVLTKPVSLEADSDSDYRAPNLLQRILSLFKNVRQGSDLSHFQLPPQFNLPKSQLQCFGESLYSSSKDMLHECNNRKGPLDRFIAVVALSMSTTRPCPFGVAPYNPILGETHHVSRGSLHVLLEQVSHHPPVSGLHATDEKANIDITWCQHPVSKFYGTKVEAKIKGKRQLKLLNHGETYVMNSPNLLIRFIPPGVDWVGKVSICCQETGLEAELFYTTGSLLISPRGNHSVQGKIYQTSSRKTLYTIKGHWNSAVTAKDVENGKETIIYNAKEAITGLKTPVIEDLQGIWPSESAVVWSEVSKGILGKKWGEAREAKKAVEEKQRELARDRESRGETWVQEHFNLSCTKESGWSCSPIEEKVPAAPIVVPL